MTKKLEFEKNGYCVVENALSRELVDFITQYALFDEMQDYNIDLDPLINGSPHAKYADPVMETVLVTLQEKIEECTGLSLYPTYSFYRVYRPGNDLKPHKDRESCQISATFCFNYNYENYAWPIYINNKKVIQKPGDLLVYKGTDLDHWRNVFDLDQDDAWHVQGFFHYVDQNGPYADFKFDKRQNLGLPLANKSAYKQDKVKPWLYYK